MSLRRTIARYVGFAAAPTRPMKCVLLVTLRILLVGCGHLEDHSK